MSQRAWTLHVKPPRDRPKVCAKAPLFRPRPRHDREPWCCRSCAASRRSGRDRPEFAAWHPRRLAPPSAGTGRRASSASPSAHACRAKGANPQDVQHSIEIAPVISGRSSMPATLGWEQRPDQIPFCVTQVAAIHAIRQVVRRYHAKSMTWACPEACARSYSRNQHTTDQAVSEHSAAAFFASAPYQTSGSDLGPTTPPGQ